MQKISRSKTLFFSLLLLLFVYAIVEICSFTFFLIKERKRFSFSEFQALRHEVIASGALVPAWTALTTIQESVRVIHPYTGYVNNPIRRPEFSEYGFPGETPVGAIRSDEKLIIGIFGGSFAEGFAERGKEALLHELKQSPYFHEKEIAIYSLALSGYKQPQQLATLTYFLALGVQFDIFVNIDGFNEIVIAEKNVTKDVFPLFPENWLAKIGNLNNPDMLIMLGEISFLTAKRKSWARSFETTPLRHSICANMMWRFHESRLMNAQLQKVLELETYRLKRQKNFGYVATGPSFHYETETDMYDALASVWQRCSLQMHKIAEANDMLYFHFLQPNQYVPGSKIMKQEELTKAFAENQPYKAVVEVGYPYLRQKGNELRRAGVNFHDLTMIFSDNDNMLYADNCCHLNEQGYRLIGSKIGQIVGEYYDKAEPGI
jgi:hypothetical protein